MRWAGVRAGELGEPGKGGEHTCVATDDGDAAHASVSSAFIVTLRFFTYTRARLHGAPDLTNYVYSWMRWRMGARQA